jgi:glyoxalase family protein
MSPSQPPAPGSIPGIHHVTAITADPQTNVDFYADVLGLRFVKRTVNFDDPGSYHLYFGDAIGHPGGIMTFFGWPGTSPGRRGTGQLTQTAFSVAPESLDFWTARLKSHGVEAELSQRFDDEVLSFDDPDGLALELVAGPGDARAPWDGGSVPAEHGIRGFRAITVTVASADPTAALLTGPMGFEAGAREGGRSRFISAHGALAGTVDVLEAPGEVEGVVAAGTVHHVAWRTPGDEEQLAWRAALLAAGRDVTHVYDRRYFHSIYFREPGGVLFEIATDGPGFTVDEPETELGARLALPPWMEDSRQAIEAHLPPITLPAAARSAR